MSFPPDDLPGMVAWIVREMAEMKRRDRNRRREGKIIAAKPAEGLYRVRFREAKGSDPAFDGPWMRVEALSAGGVKIQGEPVMGQAVTVRSESGELTDGVISLSSFSNDNPRPHDKAGELKITVSDGAYSLLLADDGSETTTAKSRRHDTAGDVMQKTGGDRVYETGGIVRFT